MQDLGRLLIVFGAVVMIAGVMLLVAPRLPWLGKLPGDILVRRDQFTFYFPVVTCVVVSIVLTVLLNIFWRR